MTTGHTYLTARQPGFCPNLLFNRFRSIGVNAGDSKLLVSEIQKWVSQCGIEWTIDYLKKIKQSYVNYMAGVSSVIPWVALNQLGLPKNSFGILAKYSCAKIVLSINVYKMFLYTKIRDSQRDKFLAATQVKASDDAVKSAAELVIDGLPEGIGRLSEVGETPTLASLPVFRPNGTFASYKGVNVKWSVPSIIVDFCDSLMKTNLAFYWPEVEKLLYPVIPSYSVGWGESAMMPGPRKVGGTSIVGTISCSQEPGAKLRHFASPFQAYQLLLEPTKRGLFSFLKERMEADCTFDHDKGLERIQAALRSGKTCYSIDLSSATDTFPFWLQQVFLSKTAISRDMQLLVAHLVKSPWATSASMRKSGYPDKIKWSQGQPLGMGPSFALFALTHHCLVRGIFSRLKRDEAYVLLGDDIVIWDDEVAHEYVRVMNGIGCSVSADKTITSNRLAEFAGLVIDRDRSLISTKHKRLSGDNFVSYGVTFGYTMERELVNSVIGSDAVLSLIASLPETVGGMGWNPKGISLEERLSEPTVAEAFKRLTATIKQVLPGVSASELAAQNLIEAGFNRLQFEDPSFGTRTVMAGGFETPSQEAVREDLIEQQRRQDLDERYDRSLQENAARRKRRLENRSKATKVVPAMSVKRRTPSLLERLRSLFEIRIW